MAKLEHKRKGCYMIFGKVVARGIKVRLKYVGDILNKINYLPQYVISVYIAMLGIYS